MELNILDNDQTVDFILKNKCSIARFGDGEVKLMQGLGIPFQKSSKELKNRLRNVKTTGSCLVCIPKVFNKAENKKNLKDFAYKFWKHHLFFHKRKYFKFFSSNKILGNTFCTRFYIDWQDHSHTKEHIDKLKQIWNKRNILFVEGEKSRLGVGNDLFNNANSIRRILGPAKNAFDKYEEIVLSIRKNANKDDLIICALGPTATILAHDLSPEYQVLDLGHIDIEYEWFLRSAEKKIAIENKYVNECGKTGRNPNSCEDKEYLKQIIDRIN